MRWLKTAALLVVVFSLLLLTNDLSFAQDSLNISMTGRIVYWDSPYSTAITGNYLYVADGASGLHVLDVSDPSQPEAVATVDLSDYAFDVVIDGDFAYVAETEFVVLDVSNPALPEQVGFLSYQTLGHLVRSVAIQGNYAYLAGYEDLTVVDVSDPTNPTIVDNQYIGMYDVYALITQSNYLYVASPYGFKAFDISDPLNPTQTYYNGSIGASRMAINGSFLYLANYDEGLYIMSLHNPAQPVVLYQYRPRWLCHDVAVNGDLIYIAAGFDGFKIINVSIPSNPQLLGSWDSVYGKAWRITLNQGRVYLSSYDSYNSESYVGIGIFDVSVPTSPFKIGTYHTWGECKDVALEGNYAFLANNIGGVVAVDVSNPLTPMEVGHLGLIGSAYHLEVRGEFVYIPTHNSAGSRLYIVNVSNPTQPSILDTAIISGSVWDLEISGDYAYLPCNMTSSSASLKIYNIANPCSLYYVGSCNLGTFLANIDVSGNFAYITYNNSSGSHGIYVVDVANPVVPTLISFFIVSGVGSIGQIVISGDYAYLPTNNPCAIKIVSISNPYVPGYAGTFTDDFYPNSMTIVGDRAYVSSGNAGVRMYSMPSPTTFNLLGYYNTPGSAGLSVVQGDYIYLADTYNFLILTSLVADFTPVLNDEPGEIPLLHNLPISSPNPFNPSTAISFKLQASSFVSLRVYDTAGRLVSTLVNGYRDAGAHEVTFDGSALPSGVYLYRLEAGEYSAVGKMVLLK